MKILILNGPNLNLLGIREPEIYGTETLDDISNWLNQQPDANPHDITWFQSNHEGDLIDQIHESINLFDGIILNPGALTHYSYALRDAIAGTNMKAVEIHLSDIHNRENFRKISVIKSVCLAQVVGEGKQGYITAIKHILETK